MKKKGGGEGKRKRKKRKKKKKDEAIDAFFFCSGRLVVDRDESGIKHRMCGLILD